MGNYVPITRDQEREMLETLGLKSVEELFIDIPKDVLLDDLLNIPKGKSQMETLMQMENLAKKNKVYDSIYRGFGAYNHYIPFAVCYIASKEEFLTTYTPYQAEINQGMLQAMFEYQTMICELTAMDLSNSSVYDGASAACEAIIMSADKKRDKALVSSTLNPQVIETINSYFKNSDIKVQLIPSKDGRTDLDELAKIVDKETACVLVSQINKFGLLEDMDAVKETIGSTPFIAYTNPLALSILKSPGEYGADIAIGEGQVLGIPLSFGGPYLGFMACTKKHMRKLPGRIVGQTVDHEGRRAFVLTLQAREQHIRREKASSNICTNQANSALRAGIYMALMGKEGMKRAANLSMARAHYLKEELLKTNLFYQAYEGEFFNEFPTKYKLDSNKLLKTLSDNGILGPYLYEDKLIWAVTEMNSKEDIDKLIQLVKEGAK